MLKKRKGILLWALLVATVLGNTACSGKNTVAESIQPKQESSIETENTEAVEISEAAENPKAGEESESTEGTEPAEESLQERDEDAYSFLYEGASDFSYNALSDAEKIWYEDIEWALGTMAEDYRLSEDGLKQGLDEECIDKIFQCVLNDHPEIFYAEGYTYTQYSQGNKVVAISFTGTYGMEMQEAVERKEEIEAEVDRILSGIDMQASEYDKVKYV